MNKFKFTAYLLIIALLFNSCKKENAEDINYTHWPVVQVDGVQQATIGQNITLTVHWPYSSGCDIVDKFETKKLGSVYSIKTLGYYEDKICTQDAGIKTITYLFSATSAGTYDLNFENPDGSVITHTILVQ